MSQGTEPGPRSTKEPVGGGDREVKGGRKRREGEGASRIERREEGKVSEWAGREACPKLREGDARGVALPNARADEKKGRSR